jgi:hydrogenase expression/formation protein HypD
VAEVESKILSQDSVELRFTPHPHGDEPVEGQGRRADIRMVYSTLDTLRIAEAEPSREVVFFAIGLETTTPPMALAIRLADKKQLKNFSIF